MCPARQESTLDSGLIAQVGKWSSPRIRLLSFLPPCFPAALSPSTIRPVVVLLWWQRLQSGRGGAAIDSTGRVRLTGRSRDRWLNQLTKSQPPKTSPAAQEVEPKTKGEHDKKWMEKSEYSCRWRAPRSWPTFLRITLEWGVAGSCVQRKHNLRFPVVCRIRNIYNVNRRQRQMSRKPQINFSQESSKQLREIWQAKHFVVGCS